MSSLVLCLENLCLLIGWSEPGMLFAGNDTAALELMMKIEPSKLCPFYGRCLAFQVSIIIYIYIIQFYIFIINISLLKFFK